MSFKRLAILALPVLTLTTLVFATDNPFARWDRLNKLQQQREAEAFGRASGNETLIARPGSDRTAAVAETPPSTQATTRNPRNSQKPVAYFSPSSPTPTAGTTTARNKVTVERLKVGQTAAPTAPRNIQRATYTPQPGRRGTIQQTAAQFGDTETANPFRLSDAAEPPPFPDFSSTATAPTPADTAAPAAFAAPTAATNTTPSNPFEDFASAPAAPAETPAAPQPTELVVPDAGLHFGTGTAPVENTPVETSPFGNSSADNSPFATESETATPTIPDFNALTEPPAPTVTSSQSAAVTPPPAAPLRTGASGPQSPTVTIRWDHDGRFNVGQNCACRMIVENTGTTLVSNVVAEAVLPAGVEVISAKPAPVATGESATWTFGELEAGQSRTVELVIVPKGTGDVDLNAYVRFTGASSSRFTVEQPMLAVAVTGPKNVEVGQSVNYTVEVNNPGTGKASNVVIQAVIPEGLQHRRGKILTIDIGTLNAGESRRARLSLTGIAGGDQKLAVRVVGDGNLTEQTIETVSVAEPKLNIGVRGPATTIANEAAEFEVVVVNEGRVESNNVRAKYRLPAGFEYVSADRGGKYNAADQTIEWFVGTLEPGKMKHMTVSLKAAKDGPTKHQVGVISEHGKMTMAEHECRVQGMAVLDVQFTADTNRVKAAGGESRLQITVSNTGTSAAEAVGLSCEVPSGMELVDVSGPSEYIADSGVIIFRSLPQLAPGETATFVVRTSCTRNGKHTARVRVASKSIRKALIDELSITAN